MLSRKIRSRRGGAYSLKRQAGHSAPKLKAIRFDDRWRAGSSSLKRRIKALTLRIDEWESAKRQRRRRPRDLKLFNLAIECIVCNLAALCIADPRRRLAIRLENAASQTSPVLGKPSRTVIDALLGLGFVSKVRGYPYRGLTTIAPTPALKRFLALKQVRWNDLRLEKPTRLVMLRTKEDEDRPSTAKADPRWLTKIESELRSINFAIRKADVKFSAGTAFHIFERSDKPTATLLTKHHVSLYRIFNNNWDEGGRLFGGVWQTMQRSKRFRSIIIDRKPVAIVDYSQLFLRLVYAEVGAKPPRGDLYAFTPGETREPSWKSIRAARKKIVNALFFSERPLRQWPGKDNKERSEIRSAFPTGTKPSDAVNDIVRHHSAVANRFGRGIGLRLMRIESDLITRVVLALNRRGIVALPIHDAVIVRASRARTTKFIMEREAKRLVGAAIPAEIQLSHR